MDLNLGEMDQSEQIVLGGAVLAAIGSVLPWASLLGVSVLGIEGDGIITLAVAVVAAAVVLVRPWDDRTSTGTVVLGGVVTLVAVLSISRVAAIGVYLTAVGGIVMVYPGVAERF